MENLDIVILTAVTSVLLIAFFWMTYREFSNVNKNGYAHNPGSDGYGREAVFFALKSIYENKPKPKMKKSSDGKEDPYAVIFENIADMESQGVYFPEDIKRDLEKMRDELYCEYSDLPSPASYEK